MPDARAIGDDLAVRGIKLSLGGQVYDPQDPMGKVFFNIHHRRPRRTVRRLPARGLPHPPTRPSHTAAVTPSLDSNAHTKQIPRKDP
nr:hypothetical protein [Nocardia beijingensis]